MIQGVATAPVSFGVYGSAGQLAVAPHTLLASAATAGYTGMELGPPGFFGTAEATQAAFATYGLSVVGSYVPIHFSADDETLVRDLTSMQHTLDELSYGDGPAGLAILADEGSPELLLNPARAWDDRSLALDDRGWVRLANGVARALELARRAGVPTTFHPHISTYVESPWEVERLLESTDVDLCIDTGHFRLAGADPAVQLARFGDRVNHVHLKDVRLDVLHRAKAQALADFDTWWADVSTALGDGDVDLVGFLERLLDVDYDGWLVVEQDRLPLGHDPIEPVAAIQAGNARWVDAALQRLHEALPEPAPPGPHQTTRGTI